MALHFASGSYRHYAASVYNNLDATRDAVEDFHDPQSPSTFTPPGSAASRLMAPLRADPTLLKGDLAVDDRGR